ncbi:MAG TPA: leucyl aminopeptidase family protein [Gammaproteobacteria bacterium]|nr:leucyl aminopeptidase family protein [Gammaproteobacteria bacterium]
MTSLLPEGPLPRVVRRRDARTLPHLDHLLVIVAENSPRSVWASIPGGAALATAVRRRQLTKPGAVCTLHLDDPCPVTIGIAAPDAAPFAWLTLARKLAAEVRTSRPAKVGVMTAGAPAEIAPAWLEAAISGLLAAAGLMPRFRSDDRPAPTRLSTITLLDDAPALDIERIRAEAEGNYLARWLTALPPNRLDAASYRGLLEELAMREGWQFSFLDERALAELGAGAFLAVARSNPHRDAGIACLKYRPTGPTGDVPHVALVGKGICFDTGGTNLKTFRSMLDMHEDMQGSAVALGALLALTRIGYGRPVDCWLAISENHIGPDAYKSRDVISAVNGVTIEVIHTDAEGRLALADALALAARDKPELIIDYATLTGACVSALTHRYSGVFGNRPNVVEAAVAAGRASGERIWPFPMDEDFDEALESGVADVLQCSVDNDGDHILAARFLQRFIPKDTPWLHIDLAAGHNKGGLAHVPTAQTGFGVRLTLAMLVDQAFAAAPREDGSP